MAAIDDLTAKVGLIQTALTSIRADITAIKNSLPTSGGLTADEVAQLSAKLDAAVSDAQELDGENPAAPTT